jgi:hypothetical protein
MGERPEVYDCALEGGVKAGVLDEGECADVFEIIGPAVVWVVACAEGSCVGGECVVR